MRRILTILVVLILGLVSIGIKNYRAETFSCSAVTEIPQEECEVLVLLYFATEGSTWDNNTNWLVTSTPSNWYGITLDAGRLSKIFLHHNNLIGTIPPELGQLQHLEDLYLSSNQLTGTIPPALGSMSSLMHLYLSNNQLSGEIPAELGNLSNLWHLDLSWNQLSGGIPPELSNLRVWLFDLSANQLTGTIPAQLGSLVRVAELQLQGNQLSGAIPPELGNFSTLQRLNLSGNQLSGQIPASLGNLASLKYLYLYQNSLSGLIPAELGNLTNLLYLDLSVNQLTSPIPVEIFNLSKLESLDLSWNPFSGSIPPEIGNLISMKYLRLAKNRWSGQIPLALCSLTSLVSLDLYFNSLSGDIPSEFQNLVNLTELNLSYNFFKVPAKPDSLANFLSIKDPDWDKYQAFNQHVDYSNEATVIALDGSTVVHIYPSSFETNATFTFIPQPEPNEQTGDLEFAGNSFQMNAIDVLGQALKFFNQPLIVEIYYDESKIGNIPERKLALYYWDEITNDWEDVVTTCESGEYIRDFDANMFSVPLCHLSEFSLFGTPDHVIFLPLINR